MAYLMPGGKRCSTMFIVSITINICWHFQVNWIPSYLKSDRHFSESLGNYLSAIIYLAADFATIARRMGLDRPRVVIPGNPRGRLRAMLEERRPLYEQLATVTVETDDLDPDELAAEIGARLKQ